ncbi:MAG: hypothetical protein PHH00_00540 [Candidatus Nanoarchaeia archaeon]|nr:hypothetical protein [Candidatus Nanoarchaeia archaeon]
MKTKTDNKIGELEGMTDCLYWRTWGSREVHCHAEHPNENRPRLIPGYECTKDCGRYTPLTKVNEGTD